jgi:S1-C subfamily serine protease
MKTLTGFLACLTISLALARSAPASAPVDEGLPGAARDLVVLAVQKTLPAVVNISTERIVQRQFRDPFDELFRQFFGQPREGIQSLGSGVIVDEDGWIVTNWHVVRRATKINITLADGTRYEAQYVSGDEKNDLALLKVQPKQALPYVEIASESEPLLGETVIAIGNPFGFEHTVTKGVISAKNRKWPPDDPTFEDILQTDAAINPGNSGGPLINTRAELVGINTAILAQAQGIGFAIPAKRVANLLAAWFSPEKRARVWLGLRFAREDGKIVVADVQAGSPAAKAGLQTGDRIVAMDGEPGRDILRLQRHLMHRKAGDAVQIDAERAGKTHSFTVKLTGLPKLSAIELMQKKFGLQVQQLSPDLAAAMGFSVAQGLLVAGVEKESPGADAGFRRGIVVTHVGGEEIQSLDRLAEQLADIKPGDTVSMVAFISERRGAITYQQTTSVSLKSR